MTTPDEARAEGQQLARDYADTPGEGFAFIAGWNECADRLLPQHRADLERIGKALADLLPEECPWADDPSGFRLPSLEKRERARDLLREFGLTADAAEPWSEETLQWDRDIAAATADQRTEPDGSLPAPSAVCHDCGRPYGEEHGFPDLIIPFEAWRQITPTEDDGGLLCPSCICKRLFDAGINCDGAFMSGPINSVAHETMSVLRRAENIELALQGRDNAFSARLLPAVDQRPEPTASDPTLGGPSGWYDRSLSRRAEPAFRVGDRVRKVTGDYRFDGTVIMAGPKLGGKPRVVVEADTGLHKGLCHIFSPSQLARINSTPPAGVALKDTSETAT